MRVSKAGVGGPGLPDLADLSRTSKRLQARRSVRLDLPTIVCHPPWSEDAKAQFALLT